MNTPVIESGRTFARWAWAAVLIILLGTVLAEPLTLWYYRPATPLSHDPRVSRLIEAILEGDAARARRILSEHRLNIDELGRWGLAPLQHALTCGPRDGRAALVRMLIDAGADVNRPDAWGHTPLMWTISVGDEAMTATLLRAGADVNASRPDGTTALHTAAVSDARADCVRMLLAAGADATARDGEGKTAGDYAREGNLPELARLLEPGTGRVVAANPSIIR
jgi:ankyrin repeat protein